MLAIRLQTFAGAGFEDASAADPVVGTKAQPTGKGFGAAELLPQMGAGADFT